MKNLILTLSLFLALLPILNHTDFHGSLPILIQESNAQNKNTNTISWEAIDFFHMSDDWKVFWNVADGDQKKNNENAKAHGFELVHLFDPYAIHENNAVDINLYLNKNKLNPFKVSEYYENIIRSNISRLGKSERILVNNIELELEADPLAAWMDVDTRISYGSKNYDDFKNAYLKNWSELYSLPLKLTKDMNQKNSVGVYGLQLFKRDYWLVGRSEEDIKDSHRKDLELWKYISSSVDFFIASTYLFYNDPGSIYYLAANIENNVDQAKFYGNKPVYAYEWLKFHGSNKENAYKEVPDYIVEAMAVLPFFSGARGIVLWGWEPGKTGQHFQNLPVFVKSLKRFSKISNQLKNSKLVIDYPASDLWFRKQSIVRKFIKEDGDCIILSVNPWAKDVDTSYVSAECGSYKVNLLLQGRHTSIFIIKKGISSEIL